jgi:plasmid stability protein
MNLTITLPDDEVQALEARATARGVSAEQYALEVLEQDLAAATEPRPAQRGFDNLSDLLLNSPFAGANLDLDRSGDQPRTIDLG